MVTTTDIREIGIELARAVRDAVNDPGLLDEKIKALDAIKSVRQSQSELSKEQDNHLLMCVNLRLSRAMSRSIIWKWIIRRKRGNFLIGKPPAKIAKRPFRKRN